MYGVVVVGFGGGHGDRSRKHRVGDEGFLNFDWWVGIKGKNKNR